MFRKTSGDVGPRFWFWQAQKIPLLPPFRCSVVSLPFPISPKISISWALTQKDDRAMKKWLREVSILEEIFSFIPVRALSGAHERVALTRLLFTTMTANEPRDCLRPVFGLFAWSVALKGILVLKSLEISKEVHIRVSHDDERPRVCSLLKMRSRHAVPPHNPTNIMI